MTILRPAIGLGVALMSGFAVLFWLSVLFQGGMRPAIDSFGLTVTTLFTLAHLPAMAGAILLWRWQVARSRPLVRWGLFLAMVYFSAACIIAVFGNFLAASVLGMMQR